MNPKSFGLFALGIFALVFVMGIGSAATLSNWNFDDSNLIVDSGTGTLTVNTGVTETYVAGNPPSGKALSSDNWDAGDNFTIAVGTSGFENIFLKFDEEVSGTGPITFQIQYSSDGVLFTNLGSAVSATQNPPGFGTTPMQTFNFSNITSIDNNPNVKLRIVPSGATNVLGVFHLDNLVVEGTAISTSSVPPEVASCTTLGNPGVLNIKSINFQNNGMQYNTFGKDDEWFPFEEVEAEIKLENNGNYDISNIEVEWGIYDTQTGNWVIDLDKEDEINLNENDEDVITVTFTIDDDMDVNLDELTDGNDYKLYVVATGEIDDSNAPNDGASTCESDFETASIIIENDFPIVTNFQVPETVQCGATVDVTADVWNIGSDDQKDISVDVYDKDKLLINKLFDIGNVDTFDNAELSLSFQVPKDAEEKTYTLNFRVLDKNSDIYKNDFDDDESVFPIPLQVSGNCGAAGAGEVSVSANIVSGGRAGQELVVKATATNTGNSQKNYALNVAGFEDWASSFSLSQNLLALDAGQSKDVSVTLDVKDDAEGSRTFFLEFLSGGEVIRQPVSVSVSESRGGFLGLTGSVINSDNWYLWGIGLLNVLLVVVIIVVAVRIARKK